MYTAVALGALSCCYDMLQSLAHLCTGGLADMQQMRSKQEHMPM